jgi:hypothetical protein
MKRIFFRICVPAFILLTLLVISFVVWRVNLANDVNAKLATIRAAGLPTSGAELNIYYPAVPDNENAALVMTQAFALMRNYSDNRSNEVANFKIPPRGQSLTTEQKQLLSNYVEMNTAALVKASKAGKLTKSRYPVDLIGIPELPYLAELKRLAFLAEYKAWLTIDDGQPADAITSITNILGMARTLDSEPIAISQLVRDALISMAENTLEHRLNAGQIAEAECMELAPAFSSEEKTNLMVRALIGDRAQLIPYFRMSAAWLLQNNLNNGKLLPPTSGHPPVMFWISGLFDRDLRFYLNIMDTNILFASLPMPRDLGLIDNFQSQCGDEAGKHHHILSAMFLPAVKMTLTREAQCFVNIHLTTVALAVERFRLAHGRLPENLNELVPQFLSAVPSDPFDSQPLRYHRLAKGYVIYSVGADGHDDGGREKPADWKSIDKTTYDITFTVER